MKTPHVYVSEHSESLEPSERKHLTKDDLKLKIDDYVQKCLFKPIHDKTLAQIRTWCTYIIMDEEKWGNIEYGRYMFVCEVFPKRNRIECNVIDLWEKEKEEKEWNEFIEQRRIEWGEKYEE